MENNQQHLEALNDIRQMMQRSNKFLSLSGFSGVFAGIYALMGAYLGVEIIGKYVESADYSREAYNQMLIMCTIVCALVLALSILTALFFSARKAKKMGQKFFDHTALRLLINMMIPLIAGGFFCIGLIYQGRGMILLVCPAMLIFYGLALVNGSKYTLHDIRYLGCMQIAIGVVSTFFLGYGILFWAFGFGVLHIVYGAFMWFKYDRKT